jgi:uncharacterized protein YraI
MDPSAKIKILLAGAALSLLPAAATAEPALVVTDLNMRASPSTQYSILDVIPGGAIINARFCISNGWCRVSYDGRLGWVSGRYLRTERFANELAPPPPVFSRPPPYLGG